MHTLRTTSCLLIVPLCFAGCASTGSVPSKLQTVASVGDKPLPVTTGEPGALVRAERPDPLRLRRSESRISGRVVDGKGEPVANALVRLAVGSTPGGKVVVGTTDRSGAFTLRGVRPGSEYTVIAESQDGSLVGRSQVYAPNTDVRISLGTSETERVPVARPRASTRISPASERESVDEESDPAPERGASKPRVNLEDVELPPAAEAESLVPTSEPRSAAAPREATTRGARWRRTAETEKAAATPDGAAEPGSAPRDPATHGTSGGDAPTEAPTVENDGPNPLPPAIEPGRSAQSAVAPSAGDEASDLPSRAESVAGANPLPNVSDKSEQPSPEHKPGHLDFDALARAEEAQPTTATVPFPPAVAEAESQSQPGLPDEGSGIVDAFAPGIEDRSPVGPDDADSTGPAPRKRPTWKDLAAVAATTPVPREGGGAGTLGQTARPGPDPSQVVLAGRPRAAPVPSDDGKSFCDFDVKQRRIRDFRLPDLEGRPVRFKDLDADLVLLDFWGTWCQPCLRSVPHLVEIQKRLGTAKVKVVGIACEQVRVENRNRVVTDAARRLKINYPVLLSGMDGPCPLQEALDIQSLPTLVLVDRQGRIVWRDQGASRLTMARLDWFLASATKADATRRY